MTIGTKVTLGCGSAMSGDRLSPAVDLANSGRMDYMVFDRMGEGSQTTSHLRWSKNPALGYDRYSGKVLGAMAPFLSRGGVVIGNFGGVNVEACGREAAAAAVQAGLTGLKIGLVNGDSISEWALAQDLALPQLGVRLSELGERFICAYVYAGADGVLDVLEKGAQFVATGRVADSSMSVGALAYSQGFSLTDWSEIAVGTMAGHMLEGGSGITGAGCADPPYRVVPGTGILGFPFVEVSGGDIVVTKLDDVPGQVSAMTVKPRVTYETGDPAAYLTPDVVMDMTEVDVQDVGPDRVLVNGVIGRERPETYIGLIGVRMGWKAVAEFSVGGPGCIDRARLAETILRDRLAELVPGVQKLRIDFMGLTALFGRGDLPQGIEEIRVRVAALCDTRAAAVEVCEETGLLYFDRPQGIGGPKASVDEAYQTLKVPVSREAVVTQTQIVTA